MAKNVALAAYKAGVKAKSKSGSRGRGGTKIPLGIVLGFVPLVGRGIQLFQAGGFQTLAANLPSSIIPYDFATRRISFANLGTGLWPIIAGLAVHRFIGGGLGVNRALAASRIPWIRI